MASELEESGEETEEEEEITKEVEELKKGDCYDFGLLYDYKFVLALGTEQVINNLQSLTEFRDQVRFCFDELKSATH